VVTDLDTGDLELSELARLELLLAQSLARCGGTQLVDRFPPSVVG
jgi:hypothetical protein